MVLKNAISWFEIPATDLARAQKFYEQIFQFEMIPLELPRTKMRLFPLENMNQIGGAIVESKEFYHPSATDGPLIYLNANPDLQDVLDRVEDAGGVVVVQKTAVSSEHGYIAVFLDSENNRIGLHSVPM